MISKVFLYLIHILLRFTVLMKFPINFLQMSVIEFHVRYSGFLT